MLHQSTLIGMSALNAMLTISPSISFNQPLNVVENKLISTFSLWVLSPHLTVHRDYLWRGGGAIWGFDGQRSTLSKQGKHLNHSTMSSAPTNLTLILKIF